MKVWLRSLDAVRRLAYACPRIPAPAKRRFETWWLFAPPPRSSWP